MSTYLVTGCAGFIGSNLVERLLKDGHTVIGVDNYSTGFIKIEANSIPRRFYPICLDLKNADFAADLYMLDLHQTKIDAVFHFAANADVRFGFDQPEKDFNENTLATFNLLNWMRKNEIKNIVFASTAAIYSQSLTQPTREHEVPIQDSFYGASKLACEHMIQAHVAGYGGQAWIYRFVSILGKRYTHGFVYNFTRSLLENPNQLYVLGGREQRKSYLDVEDCIDAVLHGFEKAQDKVNIFNVGHFRCVGLEYTIPIITNYLNINPEIIWSGNEVGWIGDSKICNVSIDQLRRIGWYPKISVEDSIRRTLDWLTANKWVFETRNEK